MVGIRYTQREHFVPLTCFQRLVIPEMYAGRRDGVM